MVKNVSLIVCALISLCGALLCTLTACAVDWSDATMASHANKIMFVGVVALIVGGEGMYLSTRRSK